MEKETDMADHNGCHTHHGDKASLVGPLWYIGWLFTVAFVKLAFWKAVLALVMWPWYLGKALTVARTIGA
jgi:uncharacterized membrane protein